jgi:hypothetical protein
MANTKNTNTNTNTNTAAVNGTIAGTLGGCPHTLATLPAGVTKNSKALWIQGNAAQYVCTATVASFIAANGGAANVAFVHVKGATPTGLHGLNAKAGSTRANCLNACGNGATLPAAQAAAKFGPQPTGKPAQKGKPNIKSAWVAMLQGTYNPSKYPMAKPATILVALK